MSSQAATLEAACYSFKPTHLCTKHCVGRLEWLGLRGGRMLTTPLGVGAPEVCSFQPTVILQQDIPHGASVVIVFSHASLFNPII